MINTFNNFFSEEEIKCLKKDIKKSKDIERIESRHGRISKSFEVSDCIKNKIDSIANTYSKNINLRYIGHSIYSKKYGTPRLPMHLDEPACEFTIDYQLDGNISWPIFINNQEFILKNNDAVTFIGEEDLHWRNKINFDENSFLELVFFHFSSDDHWFLKDPENFEKRKEKINKRYKKIKEIKEKNA